jgi:hypothetical protein
VEENGGGSCLEPGKSFFSHYSFYFNILSRENHESGATHGVDPIDGLYAVWVPNRYDFFYRSSKGKGRGDFSSFFFNIYLLIPILANYEAHHPSRSQTRQGGYLFIFLHSGGLPRTTMLTSPRPRQTGSGMTPTKRGAGMRRRPYRDTPYQ